MQVAGYVAVARAGAQHLHGHHFVAHAGVLFGARLGRAGLAADDVVPVVGKDDGRGVDGQGLTGLRLAQGDGAEHIGLEQAAGVVQLDARLQDPRIGIDHAGNVGDFLGDGSIDFGGTYITFPGTTSTPKNFRVDLVINFNGSGTYTITQI